MKPRFFLGTTAFLFSSVVAASPQSTFAFASLSWSTPYDLESGIEIGGGYLFNRHVGIRGSVARFSATGGVSAATNCPELDFLPLCAGADEIPDRFVDSFITDLRLSGTPTSITTFAVQPMFLWPFRQSMHAYFGAGFHYSSMDMNLHGTYSSPDGTVFEAVEYVSNSEAGLLSSFGIGISVSERLELFTQLNIYRELTNASARWELIRSQSRYRFKYSDSRIQLSDDERIIAGIPVRYGKLANWGIGFVYKF